MTRPWACPRWKAPVLKSAPLRQPRSFPYYPIVSGCLHFLAFPQAARVCPTISGGNSGGNNDKGEFIRAMFEVLRDYDLLTDD
jgi:hypothetical protein